MSVAAAVMALAVTAQLPLPAPAPQEGDALEVTGDRLDYGTETGVVTIHGNAQLRKGALIVRADELTYDERHEYATAKGHVMLLHGLFAAVADSLEADMHSPDQFEASGAKIVAWQKRGVTPEQLAAAKTQQELKKTGQSMLTLTGTHLRRIAPDEYLVDDLAFTPCDCSVSDPSWSIHSPHGDIRMGERAILPWPVIYVGGVPVLPLPWLYLPATDRRTGLLVPRPAYTATSGYSIDQPLFVTLGRSYDLTLTPGYYFGNESPNPPAGTPEFGVKGPRLVSELNYAPTEGTLGRITFGLIDDLNPKRDPSDATTLLGGERGLRGEASMHHVQDLGGGFGDRVDASFVSDGYYLRDLTTDILASTNQYLRSTAVLFHKDANTYLGADAVVRQDLRWGFPFLGNERDGQGIAGPKTIDRLPGLTYAIPERPLFGPISGGLQLQYARLAPLEGLTGDEGVFGYYQPCATSQLGTGTCLNLPGQGDLAYEPGEREARERLDLRPELRASLPLGPYLQLVPYVSYREDLYLGEVTGTTAQRGYGMGGVVAETELSRIFDAGGGTALRHAITPNVEIRGIPRIFGGVPGPVTGGYAYDEIDAAIPGAALNPLPLRMLALGTSPLSTLPLPSAPPPGTGMKSLLQAVVDVRQTLAVRQKGLVQQLLVLDLGQDLDLLQGRAADAFGKLVATWGPLTSTSVLRFDVGGGRVDQLSSEAMLDDHRGNAVYARFDRLLQGGSDPLRAGIDTLVGEPYVCTPQDLLLAMQPPGTPASPTPCPAYAEQVTAGVRLKLPVGLGARYEALVQPLAEPATPLMGSSSQQFWAKVGAKVPQQTVGISYGPACDCWRFEVHAAFFPTTAPSVGASLTISRFGTFGN